MSDITKLTEGYAPERGPSRHDGLPVTAFVLAWVMPPVGLILGWVSIAAAHRENRRASGLGIAGTVIGAVVTVAVTAVIIAALAAAAHHPDPAQQYYNCVQQQLSNPSLICTAP